MTQAQKLTFVTINGVMDRINSIWNNPDNPVQPTVDVSRRTEIKVHDYIYCTAEYNGYVYTCYLMWRDPHQDKNDGAPHFHPEDEDTWRIRRFSNKGDDITLDMLPLDVMEAMLYDVASYLVTNYAYNA